MMGWWWINLFSFTNTNYIEGVQFGPSVVWVFWVVMGVTVKVRIALNYGRITWAATGLHGKKGFRVTGTREDQISPPAPPDHKKVVGTKKSWCCQPTWILLGWKGLVLLIPLVFLPLYSHPGLTSLHILYIAAMTIAGACTLPKAKSIACHPAEG